MFWRLAALIFHIFVETRQEIAGMKTVVQAVVVIIVVVHNRPAMLRDFKD